MLYPLIITPIAIYLWTRGENNAIQGHRRVVLDAALILSSCSPSDQETALPDIIEIGHDEIQDVPLINGNGRATIVYDENLVR